MKAKSNEKFSETFYSLMKIVNKYDGDLSERLDLEMRLTAVAFVLIKNLEEQLELKDELIKKI